MADPQFSSLASFFGQQNEVLHHLQAIRGVDAPLATEPSLQKIIDFLHTSDFSRPSFDDLVQNVSGEGFGFVRPMLVDLVLAYISHALADHALTEKEMSAVRSLKTMLRLEEGELMAHRPDAVRKLLGVQLRRVLEDEHIATDEDLHLVDLQEIFDLGYDEFVGFAYPEVLSVRNHLIDVLAERFQDVPPDKIEALAPGVILFQRLMMLDRVFPRPSDLTEAENSESSGSPESNAIAMIWRRRRPV